jgi:hypothetical protein
MARAGRPGVDVAAIDRELLEDRLDALHGLALAAGHKTGAVARPVEAAAGAEVDEPDAPLLQASLAPDRVPPVRVAAVHEHVARVERGSQVVEDLLHWRASRDVEKDHPRRGEPYLEVFVGADLGEARLQHVLRGAVARKADHADVFLQRLPGEVSAHAAQANDAVLVSCFHYEFSFASCFFRAPGRG